ncbi:competence protein CoiA family protein [Chitinimonas taiwanensis]|uniref:competence protein CoiA family protein n=1 Tax=Chitinimonas taiwanensis TaxID=240412 RepID=UPI0035ADE048
MSLLQHFALNKEGTPVSVSEVARGMACECFCAVCQRAMMARQGAVRAWHFAHVQETDCDHAAETALHKAAKECIRRAMKLAVLGHQLTETVVLPDGRTASATASWEDRELVFDAVTLEATHGDIRPDVDAHHAGGALFIEIAVNHFVDEDKRNKLKAIGIPTMEIALDVMRHEEWDWDKLHAAVVESLDLKQWLVLPDEEALREEARKKATELALSLPLPDTPPKALKHYFKLGSATLHIYYYENAIVVWKQGVLREEQFIGLTRLMRRMGGIWRVQWDNWRLPRNVNEPLLLGLRKLRKL